MKKGLIVFCLLCIYTSMIFSHKDSQNFSHVYSCSVDELDIKNNVYLWCVNDSMVFNELILSWNALRPQRGKFVFYVRIKTKKWSSWIKTAEWGARRQMSFSSKDEVAQLKCDTLVPLQKQKAKAFQVKVEALSGASLVDVHNLFVCLSLIDNFKCERKVPMLESISIEGLPQQSQMLLKHPRARDLCSPTATSTALSFLLEKIECVEGLTSEKIHKNVVDPVDFAALVHDDRFDIYGNWALNVAAAYDISDGKVPCRVERLAHFNALYEYLKRGIPVVVSIQGPIKGSALPYRCGHLIVVIGWDADNKKVECIDSAFDADEKTKVCYHYGSFIEAWGRRKNIAYVFMPLAEC